MSRQEYLYSASAFSHDNFSASEDEGVSGYRKGGYHPVSIGDVFNDRYIVEKKLGWGHFSTVWLCTDKAVADDHVAKLVALKIQKSASQYTDAALDEIDLLTGIHNKQKETKINSGVVEILDHFVHSGPHGRHVCLVFEVMGQNLLSLIKKYNYQGIPISIVKVITKHILLSLMFLHTQCQVIHTDLKPENFLLAPSIPYELKAVQRNRKKIVRDKRKAEIAKLAQFSASLDKKIPKSTSDTKTEQSSPRKEDSDQESEEEIPRPDTKILLRTKIADLGNACWTHKHFTDDITTRQYRPPEVILGAKYSTPVDVWSVACLVFELVTGDYLFDPKQDKSKRHSRNEDHMALMLELVGQREDSSDDDDVTDGSGDEKTETAGNLGNAGDSPADAKEGKESGKDEAKKEKKPKGFRKQQYKEYHAWRVPRSLSETGKYSHRFLTFHGSLKNIKRLDHWPMKSVLSEKYKMPVDAADEMADFLTQMLHLNPKKRLTAAEALEHPWIRDIDLEGDAYFELGMLETNFRRKTIDKQSHAQKVPPKPNSNASTKQLKNPADAQNQSNQSKPSDVNESKHSATTNANNTHTTTAATSGD